MLLLYGLILRLDFSVALDRGRFNQEENDPFGPNLGYLAFGGIAPVPVVDTAVTVPIQGYSLVPFIPATGPDTAFFFYTVRFFLRPTVC